MATGAIDLDRQADPDYIAGPLYQGQEGVMARKHDDFSHETMSKRRRGF
jgi:hypothetical protein